MRVTYDPEVDALRVWTGQKAVDGTSLEREFGTAVYLGTADGHDVVGFEVLGASVYLPLGLGYDVESDTLTIGETTDAPGLVTENGDFVGYWEVDEHEPDGFRNAIGVAIRRASEHLLPALATLPQPLEVIKH